MQPYIHAKEEENNYQARLLAKIDYKSFAPIYDDFAQNAVRLYKFELEPLRYIDFCESVEKHLIDCLVLYENGMPVGFLVYTTAISEAIELNIVHLYGNDNKEKRFDYLIRKFLELTKSQRFDKIVSYPMLGIQNDFISNVSRYGFKFIGTVVLRFMMYGTNSREIFKLAHFEDLKEDYSITSWKDEYYNDAVNIVQEAFENSADAIFDPRFKTIDGTKDIIMKIVKDIYAQFLPEATSVILYKNEPVGFCFVNLTDDKIANIPIFAIKKDFQGKGLSKHLLKKSIEKLISMADNGIKPITELNTTTETNNSPALKMYRNIGFKEDYTYPQAYLPIRD